MATAERTGVVCAIGYQWRAITWVPQLRDLFARRALGLLAVRMFGSTAGRTWFTDQAAGGGQVLERASHGIDLVQAIAGPAVGVSATGVNVPLAGADRPADSEIDDVLALTLELERGAIATIQVVWQRDDLPRTYELDVIGDGARVEGVLDPEFRAHGIADGSPVDLRDDGAPSAHGLRALPGCRAGGRSGPGGLHAGAGDRVARDGTGLRTGARARRARRCRRARLTLDAPA